MYLQIFDMTHITVSPIIVNPWCHHVSLIAMISKRSIIGTVSSAILAVRRGYSDILLLIMSHDFELFEYSHNYIRGAPWTRNKIKGFFFKFMSMWGKSRTFLSSLKGTCALRRITKTAKCPSVERTPTGPPFPPAESKFFHR